MEESRGEGIKRVIPFLRKPEVKPPPDIARKIPFTEYLHVLESYAVQWDTEKVARDTWQNFFDANGYSLDNVKSSATRGLNGFEVSISGPASYDYRYLLHTGGTSKSEDKKAAGGFGEGAKIAALICLRDLGAKEVVYETEGKRVTFYMDSIQNSHYPTPVKGLFVKVEETKNKQGSSFHTVFPFDTVADKFQEARDLFYHKDNKDFLNPNVNNQAGGFTIHVGKGGNLYEAGQRRHVHEYDNSLKWNNADDVTVWTWEKSFQPDRDRGDIDKYQIETKAISKIVKGMTLEQIRKTIEENSELWHKSKPLGLGRSVLHELNRAYRDGKGNPLKFPDKYVASDIYTPPYIKDALEAAGYIICDYSLGDVGMIKASEKFGKLQEHYRMEPNESESKRIDLLRNAVKELLDSDVTEEICLFSQENEKNIIHGQYSTGRIWISQEKIRGDFAGALATFLHERDHKVGTDQSAEFSYALTDTLKKVIETFLRKADVVKPLVQDWDSVNFERKP